MSRARGRLLCSRRSSRRSGAGGQLFAGTTIEIEFVFSGHSSDCGKTLAYVNHTRRRRYNGTPSLSKIRLWRGCRRGSACRERASRAAGAVSARAGRKFAGCTRGCPSCGDHHRRGGTAEARTGALGPSRARTLAPAPPSLVASPPLASAPPSLVRRIAITRPAMVLAAAVQNSRKAGIGFLVPAFLVPALVALNSLHQKTHLARKVSISSLNFRGASRNARCPVLGITSARASGILAASA
jgi:hypothetical protein